MIRKALKKDYPKILTLNQGDVEMLSPLDETILTEMESISEIFNVYEKDGKVAGFIIVFKEGCDYWSDNYQWFLKNCNDFIYIDRIVVDKNHRKENIAKILYEDIFSYALKNNIKKVCAEIDIEPEYNYPSINFHKKMGFSEVATRLTKAKVTVSLQIRKII